MICNVKINYRPENQGCTLFTGGVLLKILDHPEYIGKHCGKYKFLKILPYGVQPWVLTQ